MLAYIRMLVKDLAKDRSRHAGDRGVGDRKNSSRSRLPVDGGHLAEIAPSVDVGQNDLAFGRRRYQNPHDAAGQEIDTGTRFALLEQPFFGSRMTPETAARKRCNFLGIERAQDFDLL